MNEINDVLVNMRKSFAFLWDEYGFNLVKLIPKTGNHDSEYYVQLENEWCELAFHSASGYLEDISLTPKRISSRAVSVSRWVLLSTGEERKQVQVSYTAKKVFSDFAEFARPALLEMLELVKTPALFEERSKELEGAVGSNSMTIDNLRAERARLHSLGLDSSLNAAMANLRKRNKHE